MNGILWALLGTLFTFSVTALGALNVFWVRREIGAEVQCAFLGFAGGVMVAASVWSLLLPGIERAELLGQISWLVMTGGFLLGVLSLLLADYLLQRFWQKRKRQVPAECGSGTGSGAGSGAKALPAADCSGSSLKQSTLMLITAITIHNIPEGMAVGLAFAMAMSDPGDASLFSGAAALALGIGIQNYPEGTAVALPLIQNGFGKKKSFLLGSMSAVVEPVFGVLAAFLAALITPFMPLLLAFAAGAMIYVVIQELLPEARMCPDDKTATLGFIAGFLIMMILDVSLG
ncbi:MAG: ZIP family metal transporter [Firmicutes bacterium]|nr:ZIP family metal transporter [Bacillota bacterium]MDY5856320.1 ZIP family metal transporter [Anaerovoracaceae bacterium]